MAKYQSVLADIGNFCKYFANHKVKAISRLQTCNSTCKSPDLVYYLWFTRLK